MLPGLLIVKKLPQVTLTFALFLSTIGCLPSRSITPSEISRDARRFSVRIEGATQGSGVIISRSLNSYTILTAWHVLSRQQPNEEIEAITYDGVRHRLNGKSIRRIEGVDLAVISFESSNPYLVPKIGKVDDVGAGQEIYVGGFPLASTAVPVRIFRFLTGDVIANASSKLPKGYQLLYSNQTLPGMSGGPVLDGKGLLVGIHGQGETDLKLSKISGIAVKTGTNQAVPISYYSRQGLAISSSNRRGASAEGNQIALAYSLLNTPREPEVVDLTTSILQKGSNLRASFLRGIVLLRRGDRDRGFKDLKTFLFLNKVTQYPDLTASDSSSWPLVEGKDRVAEGIGVAQAASRVLKQEDFNGAIRLSAYAARIIPEDSRVWLLLAEALLRGGHDDLAASMLTVARILDPKNAGILFAQGSLKMKEGQPRVAREYFLKGQSIDSRNAGSHFDLGNTYLMTGSYKEALDSFKTAEALKPKFWESIVNQAISLVELDEIDLALNALQRALSVSQSAEALYMLGVITDSSSLKSKALGLDSRFSSASYLREILWGPRLIALTGTR